MYEDPVYRWYVCMYAFVYKNYGGAGPIPHIRTLTKCKLSTPFDKRNLGICAYFVNENHNSVNPGNP